MNKSKWWAGRKSGEWLRSSLSVAARVGVFCSAAATLGGVTGCGAVDDGGTEAIDSKTEALKPEAWRSFGRVLTPTSAPPDNTALVLFNEPPALCANKYLISTIGVRRNAPGTAWHKKYYFETVQTYLRSSWVDWGGGTQQAPQNVAFESPPTCTHLDAYTPGSSTLGGQLLVAGKDTNNQIRVMLGTEGGNASATPDNPPPGPSPSITGVSSSWSTLGSTYSYPAAGDGNPALATSGAKVALTFRALDSAVNKQRVYLYMRNVPFTSGSPWGSRLTAPDFPSGMVPVGTPAITYITDADLDGFDSKFVIMVRLQGGGLSWILYRGSTGWSDGFGGAGWTQAFVQGLETDPAVEWDPVQKFLTVYYRTTIGSQVRVMHTSLPNPGGLGAYPFHLIDGQGSYTMFGAPRVTYGGGVENSKRMVLVRGYTPSTPTGERTQSLLYNQDIPHNYEAPATPW